MQSGNIFRLSVKRGDRFEWPRTWSIAWNDQDVPPAGRTRDSLTGFSEVDLQTEEVWGGGQPSALAPALAPALPAGWRVNSPEVEVLVHRSPYYLEWFWQGKRVLAERPTGALAWLPRGERFWHFHGMAADAQFFGLGEKTGGLDKRGMKFEMRNVDAMGYDAEKTDPLYKHFPFYIYRSQNFSTGVFYDNFSTSTFDFGREIDNYHPAFFSYMCEAGDLDCYFIFASSVREVSQQFTRLTGRPFLAPKWSLGYSGSSMAYTEPANAAAKLSGFLQDLRQHRIPCESFHLSSGYTSMGKRRYVFHWNRDKFPDPAALVGQFRTAGLRLIPNIKPAFLLDHPLYQKAETEGLFVKESEQGQPERSFFWDGEGSHLDFSNPRARAFWQSHIQEQLLKFGIDALWNDNNEYEIWDDEALCHGEGEPWPIKWGRPIQTLLMAISSRAALAQARPDERAFVVSRSGMPGLQRYAQTWSGDNFSAWPTLRYNLAMALNLSLSGVANTGHDIGGFAGPKPEPELFLRWIQHGIFYPRFVIHSWKEGGVANEPWMYPEILPQIRAAFRLRESLRPYFYQLLRQTHQDFVPFLRPLFYDFEDDPKTFAVTGQFMVGPNLLVANVLDPGIDVLRVYLPRNKEGWFNFHTQQWHAGGGFLEVPVNLESIPMFVRGNSFLPIALPVDNSKSLEFRIYPSKACREDFRFCFEDDDGLSWPVKHELRIEGQLSYQRGDEKASLCLRQTGSYRPPYQEIVIGGVAVSVGGGAAITVKI
ncbi:MAG: alpha-glucosidase [Bdellovibrio sp.]|nr:MAG: alpha-glucosidase [Bdellovibrio sp.]